MLEEIIKDTFMEAENYSHALSALPFGKSSFVRG
jgi:hypothetical protein